MKPPPASPAVQPCGSNRRPARHPARIKAIDWLAAEVRSSGAQLVLAPDSEFAAAHAAGEGLIAAAAVMDVRADKRADKSHLPL